jgi:hypothetical protein
MVEKQKFFTKVVKKYYINKIKYVNTLVKKNTGNF